jgi:hypothetical protein
MLLSCAATTAITTASRQSMLIRQHMTKFHGGIWGSQAPTTITATAARRFKSTDAGDVIGIDLGTTNSCVAIMVSNRPTHPANDQMTRVEAEWR